MDKKDEAFLKKLLATFRIEAGEHIARISSGLIELEKAPEDKQQKIIEDIFREAHSMKGAARAVNMTDIESLCASLETVFASLKCKEVVLTRDRLDILHAALDSARRLVESVESGRKVADSSLREIRGSLENISKADAQRLERASGKVHEKSSPAIPAKEYIGLPVEKPADAETTRISKKRLDAILLQTEGLLSAKQASAQRSAELRDAISEVSLHRKKWAKIRGYVRTIKNGSEKNAVARGGTKRDPKHSNLVEFIEVNEDLLKTLHGKLFAIEKSLEQDNRSLATMVDGLLDDVKNAAMFPFSSLLEIFPKIVRDISREQGKESELLVHGGDIEIDRRILEEMKDPLVHLVRNCIDHGIEKPEERMKKRKPATGKVTVAISHISGKKVEILVSDDGSGLDIDKIKASAVKVGLVSAAEAEKLEDDSIMPFIFHSGITSSPIITDISGRGLGLAIVFEKVEKLGGTVTCVSRPGEGTTFRIELPLSIATFRGVLVRVGERSFVLPTSYVERVLRVKRNEIKTVENRETIVTNGLTIPLLYLGDILELSPTGRSEKEHIQLLILSAAGKRIAVAVDEIVNEQEVLVKDLGKQLSRVRNIAGSTVLGNGRVIPILSAPDLLKSAIKTSSGTKMSASVKEMLTERKSILVVEDSITSRMLLKNILEAAGYNVQTAVDGVEAFTTLRTAEFELVVSDVDMPRMNGFDLTAKIRGDNRLADLPVVLVTALERREDREHGVDVGANAYIVKSSFDQSNLLDVIRKLI